MLSTHSMAEAETLCSRVAILANSEVRVIGTPLALKERFGNGFNLHIALADTVEATVDACMHFLINTVHPQAVLYSRQGRVLKVRSPQLPFEALSDDLQR